jgi:hypothetical protein
MTRYYTLVGRCANSRRWGVLFGDYSRTVVTAERQEYQRDPDFKGLRIITTEDTQAAIDAAVRVLNGEG